MNEFMKSSIHNHILVVTQYTQCGKIMQIASSCQQMETPNAHSFVGHFFKFRPMNPQSMRNFMNEFMKSSIHKHILMITQYTQCGKINFYPIIKTWFWKSHTKQLKYRTHIRLRTHKTNGIVPNHRCAMKCSGMFLGMQFSDSVLNICCKYISDLYKVREKCKTWEKSCCFQYD